MKSKNPKKRVTKEESISNKILKDEDCQTFIDIVKDRPIIRKLQVHFGPRRIALDTIGSHLDKIEVKEKFFEGKLKSDIPASKVSATEGKILWNEFLSEIFFRIKGGETEQDLITYGMPPDCASKLFKLHEVSKIKKL